MYLIRHGQLNNEKPGILLDGKQYDVSAIKEDYNEQFFETGGLSRLKTFLETNKGKLPELPAGTRLGSPVARPSKIVCIGLNYVDHAKETNATPPPVDSAAVRKGARCWKVQTRCMVLVS